jgi:hypothetical protein
MFCQLLLSLFLSLFLAAPGAGGEPADKFVVLSEFQVWADAASPEVFKQLNKLYLEKGRSHVFNLYPHYEYYVWEFPRMKKWLAEQGKTQGRCRDADKGGEQRLSVYRSTKSATCAEFRTSTRKNRR